MDRITDRGTNTLASRGLEELFFQLYCCVSFWFWREIGFGCTYLCTWSTIQLWCCVSFFVVCLVGARSLLRPEKKDTVVCLAGARSILRPEKKKFQSSVWRVVLLCQFSVLAGNRFWLYISMYLEYHTVVVLC